MAGEQIRIGDREAFGSLYSEQFPGLYRFARSFVAAPDEAEGLVQDVFCEIWADRAQWSPSGELTPYLYGTLRNHALKYLRRRRLERKWFAADVPPSAGSYPDGSSPIDILHHRELADQIRAAINRLPDRQREIFLLSRDHRLGYAEIATTLGISVKTVETQMGRALKFLRASVGLLLR